MHKPETTKYPQFFAYGAKKPLNFHSEKWLSELDKAKDCKHLGLDGGHWIMIDQAKKLNEEVLVWLADTQSYV